MCNFEDIALDDVSALGDDVSALGATQRMSG